MVSLDAPAHTPVRSPTARAFKLDVVAQMEPRIRATVEQLLDAVTPAAPFDLVPTLTFPLPATIIFSFMGVPERDWPQLKDWCGHRAGLAWGRPTPMEQVHHAETMATYRRYLRELVAIKADVRGDDFASALLAIHDEDPEALTHEEISSILFHSASPGTRQRTT
jgi:cytochrome P450